MASSRLSVSLLVLALTHVACGASRIADPTPTGEEPDAPAATAGAQALPQAVFQTTPPVDAEGRLSGSGALTVQFNMCRSRATDPGDELRFTYDFDADGTVDELGHCRARHTFTSSARARVCVSDRRPDGIVCRTYTIDLTDEPTGPEYVLTLSLNSCGVALGVRYQYLNASVAPAIPAGQSYSLSVTVDGEMAPFGEFRATAANVGQFECSDGGWQGQTYDESPLPNDHQLEMPGGLCPQRNFYVSSAIETYPSILASRVQTTVTSFQVPGHRTRIVGATTFACP